MNDIYFVKPAIQQLSLITSFVGVSVIFQPIGPLNSADIPSGGTREDNKLVKREVLSGAEQSTLQDLLSGELRGSPGVRGPPRLPGATGSPGLPVCDT